MKSTTYLEKEAEVKSVVKDLRADFEGFSHDVKIIHEDGSVFFYDRAFILEISDDWIAVVAEHHDENLFHKDELYSWHMYKRVKPFYIENYDGVYGGDDED